jgi:hypothetical protein
MDYAWLAGSAGELLSAAMTVFNDESQDGHLRGLCLRLLPLDQLEIVAGARAVYAHTWSEELRFAIEDSFHEISDTLYESLNPSSGPIASFVVVAPERSCVAASAVNVAFLLKYHDRKNVQDRWGASFGLLWFVMTNLRTGQRLTPKISYLAWRAERDGEVDFEVGQPVNTLAGGYSIGPEYRSNGEVCSIGRKLVVEIRDTPEGRKLSVK